jgi:phage shock protein C
MANKRLYRSRTDKQMSGVCGGVADYLGIDPTIVRIVWVLLTLAGGPGLVLYIIMALVVPEEPEFVQTSAEKVKNEDVY